MAINKVLVTGGLGYIGSHTCIEMLVNGYQPIIIDNLCNSSVNVLKRIESITGIRPIFYNGDVRDELFLNSVFSENKNISAAIHFAGLKAVGESIIKPIEYYDNNFVGTLTLLESMKKARVKNIIFSSSATVYGEPESIPLTEESKTGGTTNPYGTSKYMVERVLQDICIADPTWSAILLRYFNPVGAHHSGQIGEDPLGIPNNLPPYISQVAIGRRKEVLVFGSDYNTPDGTGVRDYIHVMDLASGHLAALNNHKLGLHIYNLGTGIGTSVLEIISAFEKTTGISIPYRFVDRRPGDIAECWASAKKASQELNWRAKYSLQDMVNDAWHWQSSNPNGYNDL